MLFSKFFIKFVIEVFSNIFKRERRDERIFIKLLSIAIDSFLSRKEFMLVLSLFKKEYIFLFKITKIEVCISVEINI